MTEIKETLKSSNARKEKCTRQMKEPEQCQKRPKEVAKTRLVKKTLVKKTFKTRAQALLAAHKGKFEVGLSFE